MATAEQNKQALVTKLREAHAAEAGNVQMDEEVRSTAEEILNRVESDRIKLKVNDVRVERKLDNKDVEAQLKVRNRGQMWSNDLRADVSLIDKETGKEIDREKSLKIADIPKLTDRSTYMVGGTEFMFTNQSRLRPGVYTKRGADGKVSSFFNVDKTVDFERGYNSNFRMNLDPETKQFTMTYGSKNVPLISALRAVGISDDDLKKTWGEEVYKANLSKVGTKDVEHQEKLYHAIMQKAPEPGMTQDAVKKAIKDRLFSTGLDKETTRITLGKEFEKVDGGALLAASKRIIAINKDEEEEDDRDSVVFKSHHGAADHVKENLVRNADKIVNNLKFKLDRNRQINKSLSSQTLNPFIKNVITSSQLSNPPTQTNIMSMLDESSKTTVMGEGGVGSDRAITDSARKISNSDVGFLDLVHTPEGGGVGVALHYTMGTVKIGNDIYGTFKDKSGKPTMVRPIEAFEKTIAFPDQYDDNMKPKSDKVKAIRNNKIVLVPAKEVDLIYNSAMSMFDTSSNSIPFLDSLQGNRALTASKMQSQAVTLKDRDKPLFRVIDKNGNSVSEMLASAIAVPRAEFDGEVKSVSDTKIIVKQDNGEDKTYHLYKDFPLNSESFLTNEPLVKAGDKVKRGQILADNNNTRDGQFALGANLNVAVMPYRGYNFEDSTIVSESAAKKLTSLHNYDLKTKRSSGGVFSKDKFKAYYPNELNKDNMDKLDDDGVVKVGQKVNRGEVLIAHLERRTASADDLALGRLDKQLKKDMSDNGVRWDNDHVGVVTNVEKHGNQVVVNVKTEEQLKVADKISGLHGNKHIVSAIVKDEEMPFNPRTGKRIDITMSPIGVSNRINTSQLIEMAAGKIARETGKQYDWMNFTDTDNTGRVLEDLNKNGIPDKEELIDPKNGKPFLNKVFTGYAHILKLEHKVDHKLSSRYKEGYDANEQPLSGGHSGSKNLGRMEMAALLARKGNENLKEMFNVKGQKNDDYWRAIETGNTPPPPKDSFAWDKFGSMLKGAGLNIEQKGKVFTLRPMVDADIEELSAGELKRPFETFRKKDLAPMRGGLFDPSVTGGLKGDNYSHFKLPEKTLNPSMAMAASSILDLPQSGINDIMTGKSFVDKAGNIVPPGTKDAISGGPAMEILLSKIDVKREIKDSRKESESTTNSTALNKLHRKIRVLEGLQKQGLQPTDYLTDNVLVVPPKYRPVSAMGTDGSVVVSDVNDLYQQLAMTSGIFGDLKTTIKDAIRDKDVVNLQLKDARAAIYNDMNALAGYSDPTSYLHRLHKRKGFVSLIDAGKDKQTKSGFFQRKVIQRKQDLVGRSTIILNPELGGDEVGIPKEMASKIFQPFIMQKLVGLGYTPLEAAEHVEKGSDVFNRARELVANERLVIVNRAPTLHRYNMMALKPKLVDGKAIQTPATIISKNLGGDFDGDSGEFTILISVNAEKLLKNDNLKMWLEKTGYDDRFDIWIKEREVQMPHKTSLYIEKDEKFLHINLSEMPRIEGSESITESGNIEYDVPDGISVITTSEDGSKTIKSRVTKFSIHHNLAPVITTVSTGVQLITSADHSLVYLNMDTWKIEKCPPKEIMGKAIPRVFDLEDVFADSEDLVEIPVRDFSKDNTRIECMAKPKVELTRSFGHLLGMVIGDGWVSRDQVILASTFDELCESFSNGIDSMLVPVNGGTLPKSYISNNPHEFQGFECFSRKIVKNTASLSGNFSLWVGLGAENKHLPPFFMKGSKEFRLGLLSGLLDTDGTFSYSGGGGRTKKQLIVGYDTKSARLANELIFLCKSLGISASITPYKDHYFRVSISTMSLHGKGLSLVRKDKKKIFEDFCAAEIQKSSVSARLDLVPISKEIFSLLRTRIKYEQNPLGYALGGIKDGLKTGCCTRDSALKVIEAFGSGLPQQWLDIVNNKSITWVYAKSVESSPSKITMYDITVPGPYTFSLNNGIIVFDTLQLHVPISQKALKEAETMMPSGGMFKEGWGSILNTPGMDMTIGSYLASKGAGGKVTKLSFTSLEAAQDAHRKGEIEMSDTVTIRGKKAPYVLHEVNAILPPDHQKWDVVLSQKESEKWISEVSEKVNGRTGLALADKLKTVGNDYSTRFGYTLGLEDTSVEKKLRDKVLKKAEANSKSGKDDDIVSAYNDAKNELETLVKEKHGDSTMLGIGMKSGGSKGIGNTLAITAMPGILADASGTPIPIPVTRSYSEGLDLGGYVVASHGARSGNIQKSVSSFKPGWLTKDLVNSIYSVNINNEDDVDDEGIEYDVSDSKGINRRFLARDVKDSKGKIIASRNDLVNDNVMNNLKKAKVKSVYVRSPLTDPTRGDGISSYSYGVDYSGKVHKRGDAIGVMSAHTITEPSLNMAMKAFHTGGSFSGKKRAAGTKFDALDRVFRFNANVPNKAAVSPVDGTVASVKKSDVGGYNVSIRSNEGEVQELYIESGNEPTVKTGAKVTRGQFIDSGTPIAQDVLKYKGMRETQKFLVNELFKLNEDGIDKRDLETLVRGLTNTTKVINPGLNTDFSPGDVAPLTTVESMNRNRIKEVDLPDAVGAKLNKSYGNYSKGTLVDSFVQKDLDKRGHDKLEVELPEITHAPFLTPTGIGARAGASEDWIARLAHSRIRDVLQMGGSMGWKSDVSDEQTSHPVSRLATGVFK